MKTRLFILICLSALFIACKENKEPVVTEAEFEVSLVQEDNSINLTVAPSDENAVYIAGLIMEDDWNAFGGESGLTSYIEELVGSGLQLRSGAWSELYLDLFWQTKYYGFVAQINDGVIVGEPVVKEVLTYRPFVSFAVESVIGPVALSDNGLYAVGNSESQSWFYDVRLDSITIVPGLLYDVADDGTAYGSSGPYPMIWKDGNATDVTGVPEGATENLFFSVTPDGQTAVGYCMLGSNDMRPIIYRNGALSVLEYGNGPDGEPAQMACAKGIGSNGYITGYILDATYMEVGCAWTPDLKFDMYPSEYMVWNDGFVFWESIYGGLENFISPNGRYIISSRTDTGDDGWGADMYPYIYDTETKEMHDVPHMGYRPDAVSSQGLLFLSDTDMGYSSQPYVYDPVSGEMSTFAEYAAANYDYAPEGLTMQGSVVGVSEDGKTILSGHAADENYYTVLYFLPR